MGNGVNEILEVVDRMIHRAGSAEKAAALAEIKVDILEAIKAGKHIKDLDTMANHHEMEATLAGTNCRPPIMCKKAAECQQKIAGLQDLTQDPVKFIEYLHGLEERIVHIYIYLFPRLEYVSSAQALAHIERRMKILLDDGQRLARANEERDEAIMAAAQARIELENLRTLVRQMRSGRLLS